jgi:hypothetical protein
MEWKWWKWGQMKIYSSRHSDSRLPSSKNASHRRPGLFEGAYRWKHSNRTPIIIWLHFSDLPPASRTSVKAVKSVNLENDGHEKEQIHRRADHRFHPAGGGRPASGRRCPASALAAPVRCTRSSCNGPRPGSSRRCGSAGLAEYDDLEGIAWRWQSIDGAMFKAPLAQEAVGPNPTDRGKKRQQASPAGGRAWRPVVTRRDRGQRARRDADLRRCWRPCMVKRPSTQAATQQAPVR